MPNYLFEKIESIDSTNDQLTREVENELLNSDKVLVARHQTNGHGLNGRTFISDNDVGIYFTLLHFYNNENELKFITQKVAVAVYLFFKEVFNIELQIKWVNDLYYNTKKICGILCRNLIKHKALIIGVGIDLFENEKINEEIKDIAGYIFKDRADLLKKLKNCFLNDKIFYAKLCEDFQNDSQWEPDEIVAGIVKNVYKLIKSDGLPKLYIDKNIIKDERVYEDFNLEC